jgi:hypothetical protein
VDTWQEAGAAKEEMQEVTTIGFVTKLLWGSGISLDGDGGFGLHVLQKHFIFKPVTLQCLWITIQTLHAISARLRPKRNSMMVGEGWDWVAGYEEQIYSPQTCINQWNEMPDVMSRRPLSPDHLSVGYIYILKRFHREHYPGTFTRCRGCRDQKNCDTRKTARDYEDGGS